MIIAKFIPLWICALLGITEAAAQVYLFTHKISGASITNLSFVLLFDFQAWLWYIRNHQSSLAIEPVLSWNGRTNLCFHAGVSLCSRIGGYVQRTCIGLNVIHLPVGIGSGRWPRFVYNQKYRLELLRLREQDVGEQFSFSFLFPSS